jgi:thiopurine S-methyltransferase
MARYPVVAVCSGPLHSRLLCSHRRFANPLTETEESALEKEFWLKKWDQGELGFHMEEVNPALVRHWPALCASDLSGDSIVGFDTQRVLVPLCGKTRDVLWFLAQGYSVTGIELSELALAELAEDIEREFGWRLEKDEKPGQIVWTHPRVTLICGDLFDVQPTQIGEIRWLFDRAALVALPSEMRVRYAKKLMALAPGASQLLVVFEYDQSVMAGPPFSIDDSEVQAHYSGAYRVELLKESDEIEHEKKFKQRGLSAFIVRCYRLTPIA